MQGRQHQLDPAAGWYLCTPGPQNMSHRSRSSGGLEV
jgi:hypothetical protein